MLEDRINTGNDVPLDSAEPFSNPPELDHLVGNVRILEEWFSATYRRRITEITQLLSNQIAEELRCQFEQERRPLIEPADSQSESTIEALKKEIALLKEGSQSKEGPQFNDGFSEIDRIEKQISEIEAELEHSFTVDSVPLSRLLQLRTTQTDLKSYLRGLKFFVGKSTAEANAAEEPSLRS
jgi:hypothetical protein